MRGYRPPLPPYLRNSLSSRNPPLGTAGVATSIHKVANGNDDNNDNKRKSADSSTPKDNKPPKKQRVGEPSQPVFGRIPPNFQLARARERPSGLPHYDPDQDNFSATLRHSPQMGNGARDRGVASNPMPPCQAYLQRPLPQNSFFSSRSIALTYSSPASAPEGQESMFPEGIFEMTADPAETKPGSRKRKSETSDSDEESSISKRQRVGRMAADEPAREQAALKGGNTRPPLPQSFSQPPPGRLFPPNPVPGAVDAPRDTVLRHCSACTPHGHDKAACRGCRSVRHVKSTCPYVSLQCRNPSQIAEAPKAQGMSPEGEQRPRIPSTLQGSLR